MDGDCLLRSWVSSKPLQTPTKTKQEEAIDPVSQRPKNPTYTIKTPHGKSGKRKAQPEDKYGTASEKKRTNRQKKKGKKKRKEKTACMHARTPPRSMENQPNPHSKPRRSSRQKPIRLNASASVTMIGYSLFQRSSRPGRSERWYKPR